MPEQKSHRPDGQGIVLSEDEGLILQKLLLNGPYSRTDLARAVNFSRSKVSDLIGELLGREILQEIDRPGEDHSKLKNLAVNPNLGYLAGIDIGTTSVDVALADCSCELIDQKSAASHVNDGPERVLQQAAALLAEILQQQSLSEDKLLGIGVGVPGPVSYPSGEVIGGQFTPGWEGHQIQHLLSKVYPDVVIMPDNDANLMAIGSHKTGLAHNTDNFIFVKIGTGIGSGVFCRGQLYRGATSCAGHIGHVCVDFNGPTCRCGNKGCLEALAGGPAIAGAAEKAVADGKSEILSRLQKEHHGSLSAKEVGQAAAMHDQAAQQIIIRSGTLIGSVLAGVVNLYNPELIVLGGGISKLGDLFLAEIRREVLKRTYAYTSMGLRIEFSRMIDSVGVIGALHFIRDWVFTVAGKPLASIDHV